MMMKTSLSKLFDIQSFITFDLFNLTKMLIHHSIGSNAFYKAHFFRLVLLVLDLKNYCNGNMC